MLDICAILTKAGESQRMAGKYTFLQKLVLSATWVFR